MIEVSFLNACSNVLMKNYGKHGHALASNTVFFTASAAWLWIATVVSSSSLALTLLIHQDLNNGISAKVPQEQSSISGTTTGSAD